MSYRSIMAHVEASAGAKSRLAAAVSIAARFKCPLTGAFLRTEVLPDYMFADVVSPMPPDVIEGYVNDCIRRVDQAAAAAKAAFMAAAGDKVMARWLEINGDTSDELITCAKRHDLSILPPHMDTAFGEATIPAAEVGMAAGGPVLVLKHGGFPMDFGRRILIAWNDSRESIRAVRDAWPFIEAAEQVHFLRVGPEPSSEFDPLMQRWLNDHGCPGARLHVDANDASPVEDLIRLHVGKTGADMIVLGLYGHSRLREFVLGGVSRSLLTDPPMPLLLSH